MSKHTPGPWKCQTHLGCKAIKGGKWASHRQAQYKKIAHTVGLHNESEDLANARRIVACVNACEGINPEAVTEMLKVLKAVEPIVAYFYGQYGRGHGSEEHGILPEVRAAIAKAEKE